MALKRHLIESSSLRSPIPAALVMVFALVCNRNEVLAQKRYEIGNTITVRGNTIGLSKPRTDTVIDMSWHHRQPDQLVITGPEPIFLNGNTVYRPDEDSTIVLPMESIRQFERKLTENVEEVLRHFPDGLYIVFSPQFLINEKGEVIYYIFNGLTADSDDKPRMIVSDVQEESVSQILEETAKMTKLQPATKNGIPVPVFLGIRLGRYNFRVKNHFISRKAPID